MYACVIHCTVPACNNEKSHLATIENKAYSSWMEFIAQQYHFLVKVGPDTNVLDQY